MSTERTPTHQNGHRPPATVEATVIYSDCASFRRAPQGQTLRVHVIFTHSAQRTHIELLWFAMCYTKCVWGFGEMLLFIVIINNYLNPLSHSIVMFSNLKKKAVMWYHCRRPAQCVNSQHPVSAPSMSVVYNNTNSFSSGVFFLSYCTPGSLKHEPGEDPQGKNDGEKQVTTWPWS